jgi:predicted nucleotidyltransferase
MTLQLQQKAQKITDEIVKEYKPEKVILFGSAASEASTDDSDLDFCIIKSDVPIKSRDRYYDLVGKVHYDWPSDFLILTPQEVQKRLALGDPFMEAIMTKGSVLYG